MNSSSSSSSSYSSSTTTTTVDVSEATTISTVHPDVLLAHIFTRLDGPTLAAASCSSSQLHTLSEQQNLWTDICHSTWPSTNHPRMRHLINSTYPNGPRSFFSDSFPLLVPNSDPPPSHLQPSSVPPPPPELISAVDIHYKKNLIFSKVQETETLTGWFRCSPFRIDLLDPKDVVPTSIQFNKGTCQDLAENLKLSWIVVDPIGRRAANLSSVRPVSVQQHWLTGEIELKFVTILVGDHIRHRGGSTEFVQSEIVVTCGGSEGGDMHVREVSLKMEDMDGMNLSGKDSLGILHKGMMNGKRKKGGREDEEGRGRYEEYLRMKEEREERKLRREGRLDRICIVCGVFICSAFCMFAFFS